MAKKKIVRAFKCTRADGTDFRTGTLDYAKALKAKKPVEVLDAEPPTGSVCGHGIHVSPTARKTILFASGFRPWRWFEGIVAAEDVIEKDENKLRVRRFTPTKELTLADIFGKDFGKRIEEAKADVVTWKAISWLRPAKQIADKPIKELFSEWHAAITPWLAKGRKLPAKVQVVRTAANAAAANAADDANADAAAAANAADDAADAAAAAAANANADADADAAADDLRLVWYWWCRWYVWPRYVLLRSVLWKIAGMKGPNPWKPLVAMYRLGAMPIGYSKGAFVVYCPDPEK